jgi:LysM repeat protein
MDDKDNAQNIISSYRRRQQLGPFIIGALAVVLVIVGIVVLVVWLTGPNRPVSLRSATATPTNTETLVPTETPTLPPPTATSTATIAFTDTVTPTITETPTVAGPFEYIVLDKDTCVGIAAKFKVDVMVLIALNNLTNSCIIQIGQKIMIPAPGQVLPSETPVPTGLAPGTHITIIVKSGDTLGGIASRYNSTVDAIVALNKLANANSIEVGQSLIIPVNIATAVPTRGPTNTSIVVSAAPNNTAVAATSNPSATPKP